MKPILAPLPGKSTIETRSDYFDPRGPGAGSGKLDAMPGQAVVRDAGDEAGLLAQKTLIQLRKSAQVLREDIELHREILAHWTRRQLTDAGHQGDDSARDGLHGTVDAREDMGGERHVGTEMAPSSAVPAAEPGLPSGGLQRIPPPGMNRGKMNRSPALGRGTSKGASGPAGARSGLRRVPEFAKPYKGMT